MTGVRTCWPITTGASPTSSRDSSCSFSSNLCAGWSVQPDSKLIFQSGGNVAAVKDTAVVGALHQYHFLSKEERTDAEVPRWCSEVEIGGAEAC